MFGSTEWDSLENFSSKSCVEDFNATDPYRLGFENHCLIISIILQVITNIYLIHTVRHVPGWVLSINTLIYSLQASQVAQWGKNLPAMQETQESQFPSPGQGDPLEESMANHSSILAWRIPWTKEPGRLQSTGSQKVRHNWATHTRVYEIYISIRIYGCFCATVTSNLIHETENICSQAFYRKSCWLS